MNNTHGASASLITGLCALLIAFSAGASDGRLDTDHYNLRLLIPIAAGETPGAEPAGSRTTDAHYQVDLNYTQNIPLGGMTVQLIAEVLNLFDKQTGYSPNPVERSSLFGVPALQYAPRRFELAARLRF